MIITLRPHTNTKDKEELKARLLSLGVVIHESTGENYTILGLVGDTTGIDARSFEALPYVDHVTRIGAPYKLVNRLFHPQDTIVDVAGVKVGASEPMVIMAGPCAVEDREQLEEIAQGVKQAGARILRGGAYKPRTSPYSFQGLGEEALDLLVQAKQITGLPVVSELMDENQLELFEEKVDLIQIGARNMQNYALLKALGQTKKPVLLKRGFANTIEEWLMAAEYLASYGNPNIILCERGIRTFESATRNTLDLAVIPIIKKRSHLPIIIDPSHATGDWELVESAALAATAAGADGLIIEVHNHPEKAKSDGAQSLKIDNFTLLMEKCKAIAPVVGRRL
ncbi:MAG: 3-deoxy-7-phosphoheptulonate synthase [Erysipelotrichaceae bacterium]|jgi:3-deoxy-7-phosphoheptulonate synthase|nr:3-deoxy-7-phosphoheptulonate synthase [Erysipelotrichaceae bacterium]